MRSRISVLLQIEVSDTGLYSYLSEFCFFFYIDRNN